MKACAICNKQDCCHSAEDPPHPTIDTDPLLKTEPEKRLRDALERCRRIVTRARGMLADCARSIDDMSPVKVRILRVSAYLFPIEANSTDPVQHPTDLESPPQTEIEQGLRASLQGERNENKILRNQLLEHVQGGREAFGKGMKHGVEQERRSVLAWLKDLSDPSKVHYGAPVGELVFAAVCRDLREHIQGQIDIEELEAKTLARED